MLEEIILELGDNYDTSDREVLVNILNRATSNALSISNRTENYSNKELLKDEIIECVKTTYLQRGAEDVSSQSQSGLSNTFKDACDIMRKNIIKNGKRKLF